MSKGTLSYAPKSEGAFVGASYSVQEEQFLALSNRGEVYYSENGGADWHPDYSTMQAGTGLISTADGDFAFTSAGVFKRVPLGDPTEEASADESLRPFKDGAEVSSWAVIGVADSVQSGIVKGRGNAELAPQAHMTRAEAAILIRALLQKSGLI